MSWWRADTSQLIAILRDVASPRYEIDDSQPKQWDLVIRDVQLSDAAEYICQINVARLPRIDL
ncbi:unnamed protein product [Protopolystoma xenopodis]|uniref:Ig-like domain-containing protein n=1 Tax=Protopolystoma xenopodis TaxID=117903 RepID=A0A3S5C1H0_9PLAT|nr:unnamed protein product [Protopolystoma xenopodis]